MTKKIFFLLLVLQPLILNADIIYLKNGKIFHGKIARQTLTKIELILPDKKPMIINKNDVKKIYYISWEELQRIRKQRRLQKRKKQEELRKKEKKEEELKQEKKQKLEEQKRKIEDKQLKELERLKDSKKKERKQDRQEKILLEQVQIEQIQKWEKQWKKNRLQYQSGIGLGSFYIPLNQLYHYYDFFTEFSEKNLNFYTQYIQLQLKSLPDWNWAGNLHLGISYFYQDWEGGILLKTIYQKPDPTILSIPNKDFINRTGELQYETYSENRLNQKKYNNNHIQLFIKIGTEEYFNFFWNYIFPYMEIGYLQRNFQYNVSNNSSLITSKRNTITDQFEISNFLLTENTIKNQLQQDALSIGIPFRFLMIFSSEFQFEFNYLISGKSQLHQMINEININNSNLSNMILIDSKWKGKFSGTIISFLWQDTFLSTSDFHNISYFRFSKAQYRTEFTNISGTAFLLIPENSYMVFNEVFLAPYNVLYRKEKLNIIKENSVFVEFGIKIQQIF